MEIIISVFLGVWLSGASILAYIRLKKEFQEFPSGEEDEK